MSAIGRRPRWSSARRAILARMDPASTLDFGHLAQYGAIGIIAGGLLLLVVGIFRQLVTHILKQNEQRDEYQREMQGKTLESLHAIGQGIRDINNEMRSFKIEVSRNVADMVRDEVTSAGSRAHRIDKKPPRGGG
jgi:hypothetical protein